MCFIKFLDHLEAHEIISPRERALFQKILCKHRMKDRKLQI